MILFEKDYSLMNKEHFDINTSNRSFVRMYSVLKRMGISNNKFFLIILDTDLIGIDPHNLKDDSLELKMRIVREAKLNPWYFFRSIVRVPATGSYGDPFVLNRANLNMIWLYFNHIDNLVIMPRQIGKTIGSLSITAAVVYLLGENVVFSMFAKDATLRKENVERLKDIRDALPAWWVNKQRDDIDNKETLSYDILKNRYISYVAQPSISGAEKLARGMTTPSQHWDEICFFDNIAISYPNVISSTNAAVDNAKKHNQPYGNILTTTAGSLATNSGQFVYNKLICNSFTFTEKLYDLNNNEELINIVKSNSRQCMIYSEFSYKQLGKTDEWFIEKSSRTAGDDDKIAQDYLNRWSFGNGKRSPVDKAILDKMHANKCDPEFVQYIDEFMIRWYIPETIVKTNLFLDIPIAIGMDASENVGRDFTSFVFTDVRDLSVIATCTCNTTNIILVAMFISRMLVRYSNLLFIPERNSVGCAIVDYCLLQLEREGINPFYRIFNSVIQDFDTLDIPKAKLSIPGYCNEHKNAFGFRTTGQSRPLLYKTVFKRLLELACNNVRDIALINQISGLTIKNGRVDHGQGGHDDSVIAYILTGHAVLFGNNLDMYDFCKGSTDIFLQNLGTNTEEARRDNIDQTKIAEMKDAVQRMEKQNKFIQNDTMRLENLHKIQYMKEKIPAYNDDRLMNPQSVTQLNPKKTYNAGSFSENQYHLQNFLSGI